MKTQQTADSQVDCHANKTAIGDNGGVVARFLPSSWRQSTGDGVHSHSHLSQESSVVFWYSKNEVIMLLASFFLIVLSISYLVPPFQSPDEFNHLKRAYLLSKGEIFLETVDATTGGNIDTGLLSYMQSFDNIPFYADEKVSKQNWSIAKTIEWSGKTQFSDLPNTAAYFPLPYIPQALAITAGKHTGLSVGTTYYLARIFSLISTIGLLWAAFLLYPVPLIVLALFVTPMTLFQAGSTSLDSVSFAISALGASLFMRGSDTRLSFNLTMEIALLICLFSLATTRAYLVSLTLLPAVLYTIRRSRSYLIYSAGLIVLSLAWITFAVATPQGAVRGMSRQPSALETAKHYLSDPASFFHALFSTVTDGHTLQAYWKMFVGVLGWLDTLLDSNVYITFGVLFATLAIISLQRDKIPIFSRGSLFLASFAMLSMCFLFVIALLSWTPPPAKLITGIQGRYFTPILVLLGFSVFNKRLSPLELRIGLFIIFLMLAVSIVNMAPGLLQRYWMGGGNEKKAAVYHMQPSAKLDASLSLKLAMTPDHQKRQVGLERIGVMFRTYSRTNSGDAELRLKGPGGSELIQRFSLTELGSDRYRYFELDGKQYTTGEIVSVTGEGISTVESHDHEGGARTCMNYWYIDRKRSFTPGCPFQ